MARFVELAVPGRELSFKGAGHEAHDEHVGPFTEMQDRRPPRNSWRWFLAWSAAGALAGFAVLAAASVGLLVLPFAALAFWVVAANAPNRDDLWGIALGAGIACAAIGVINLDYYAGTCPERDNVERLPNGGTRIDGCGGFDPVPFFLVAAALTTAAIGARAWARSRHSRR